MADRTLLRRNASQDAYRHYRKRHGEQNAQWSPQPCACPCKHKGLFILIRAYTLSLQYMQASLVCFEALMDLGQALVALQLPVARQAAHQCGSRRTPPCFAKACYVPVTACTGRSRSVAAFWSTQSSAGSARCNSPIRVRQAVPKSAEMATEDQEVHVRRPQDWLQAGKSCRGRREGRFEFARRRARTGSASS